MQARASACTFYDSKNTRKQNRQLILQNAQPLEGDFVSRMDGALQLSNALCEDLDPNKRPSLPKEAERAALDRLKRSLVVPVRSGSALEDSAEDNAVGEQFQYKIKNCRSSKEMLESMNVFENFCTQSSTASLPANTDSSLIIVGSNENVILQKQPKFLFQPK